MSDDPERIAREHLQRTVADGAVDETVLAPEYRIHANSHEPRTVADQQAALDVYREAFPDLTVAVEDGFATEDRVALRFTVSGTHEGEIHGVDATGATVEVPGMVVYRVEDGRLAEAWYVVHTGGFVQGIEDAE